MVARWITVVMVAGLMGFAGCGGDDDSGGGACGNGMLDTGEMCDGTLVGVATCTTLMKGSGVLQCTASCTYDTTMCSATGTTGSGTSGTGG